MYDSPVDKPPLDEDTLAHFGVKGMKWGIVHDEPKGGGRKSGAKDKPSGTKKLKASNLTAHERAVLKAADTDVSHSASMQAKYGPGTLGKEQPKHHLTPQQKKIIGGVVVVAGVAGAMYFMNKQGVFGGGSVPVNYGAKFEPTTHAARAKTSTEDLLKQRQAGNDFWLKPIHEVPHAEPDVTGAARAASRRAKVLADREARQKFSTEWDQYVKTAGARERGYTNEMVDRLSTQPTHLSAGTIFSRVSTERETDIRPSGFFATHEAADTERYKAILPVFWKQWGYAKEEGYVVKLKANGDIKAPAPKEVFETFKKMLNDDVDLSEYGLSANAKVRDVYGASRDDDTTAKMFFPMFTQQWNTDTHPVTQMFVQKMKDLGYNALPDMNDAGALSKNPLKLLDGNLFSIDSHEPLSRDAIKLAQDNIQALIHALFAKRNLLSTPLEGGTMFDDDKPSLDELMHHGVKGMKWGKHKSTSGGSSGASPMSRVGQKVHDYNHKVDSSGVSRSQARRAVRANDRQTTRHLEDFQRSHNRSQQIKTARSTNLEAYRSYQDAKSEIKAKKATGELGKNAARVELAKIKNKAYTHAVKAESKTTGEQFMESFFGVPGVGTR